MGFRFANRVLKRYREEPGVTDVMIPKSVTSFGAPASDGWEEILAVLRSRGQYHGGSIYDIKYR